MSLRSPKTLGETPKAQWLYWRPSAADKSKPLYFYLSFHHNKLATLHHWGNVVPEYWLGVNLSSLKHTVNHIFVEEIANQILCMYRWATTSHFSSGYFKCVPAWSFELMWSILSMCPQSNSVVITVLKGISTNFSLLFSLWTQLYVLCSSGWGFLKSKAPFLDQVRTIMKSLHYTLFAFSTQNLRMVASCHPVCDLSRHPGGKRGITCDNI